MPRCPASARYGLAGGVEFNQGGSVRREQILAIWIGGLVLAVLLYVIGPERFFNSFWTVFDALDAGLRHIVRAFGYRAYEMVRAVAIALYVVFAVLAVLASRRGHGGIASLVIVTFVCVLLVGDPFSVFPAPLGRWLLALILVLAGAVVMTQRLMGPSRLPPRGPVPPFPPRGAP